MKAIMGSAKASLQIDGQTNFYKGKVRDVYTINNDLLVAVASNRISAFDVILPEDIPYKGQVLNQIATHFLEATSDIAKNWLVGMPAANVSVGHKCKPYALEIVVRSCLVGHAWRTYKSGKRQLCGVDLKEGLEEYSKIKPIITPATKAEEGHDEDISYEEIIEQGLASKEELDEMYKKALKLFAKGQEMAAEQGLFLADTKYEFGKLNDEILVIDEIHTPDSSRYFYAESLDKYLDDKQEKPKHLSKEFVREWLLANDFSGQDGQTVPEMTKDIISNITNRYIEVYEAITGKEFVRTDDQDVEKLINKELNKLNAAQ